MSVSRLLSANRRLCPLGLQKPTLFCKALKGKKNPPKTVLFSEDFRLSRIFRGGRESYKEA